MTRLAPFSGKELTVSRLKNTGRERISRPPPPRSEKPERLTPLPAWAKTDHLEARYMVLDGSDMAGLGIAIPPLLRTAVAKRIGEYRAGRACARVAMSDAKLTMIFPPPDGESWPMIGPDRAPVWPKGLTGSLTHTDLTALCVVGSANHFAGLGVDVETAIPNHEMSDIAESVSQPHERRTIAASPWAELGVVAIFSAKEAIFKALYPKVQRFVDFDEVSLSAASSHLLEFELTPLLSSQLNHETHLNVHISMWHGEILTFCARPSCAEDASFVRF